MKIEDFKKRKTRFKRVFVFALYAQSGLIFAGASVLIDHFEFLKSYVYLIAIGVVVYTILGMIVLDIIFKD